MPETIAPLSPEWHAARRKGIGASEISAVLGISPWESPFSLFWRKTNGWDFEPSAQMEWGTRLEEAIAAKYQDNHPDERLIPGGLREGDEPWQLATPDRMLCTPTPEELVCWRVPAEARPQWTEMAALELKTAHSADGWGEPGTDDIPVYYRAQIQWQMLVTDVAWAAVAVLIGGSDYREYVVLRDEKDIAVMVEAGRRFMHRLETGDPPPIDDHTATLRTLKQLHPDLDDHTADVPEPVAAGYLRAVSMVRKAESMRTRYEIALREAMGSAHKAQAGGRRVATRVISEVGASTRTVAAHRRDYLLAPKEPKP